LATQHPQYDGNAGNPVVQAGGERGAITYGILTSISWDRISTTMVMDVTHGIITGTHPH